ncbi:MAG: TetR/AcrR family transcriptional regulator [Candidatus Hodarchaeales archaeon]|jgi:AcrR family transcriptional regulator
MNANDKSDSPKKRRKARERKNRQEVIIKIAERYFVNQGYEQTMVDQIAVDAGYSKATIYNYFESKDDLFTAVVSQAFEKMYYIFENFLKQPGVKYELRSLGDAYLAFVDEFPDQAGLFDSGRLNLLIGQMIEKERTNQPLTESEEEFRTHQLKIERLMTSVIEETMKNAGIEAVVDPFSVIIALSTLGQAIRELVMRGKASDQPEEKSREYLNVLFNIIDKGLKHYDDEN